MVMMFVSSRRLQALADQLSDAIQPLPGLAAQLKGLLKLMSLLDDKISALQADVANLTSQDEKATTLISGLSQQLSTALQQAKDAGMTADQAQQLDALDQALKDQAQGLAQALTANTPATADTGAAQQVPA